VSSDGPPSSEDIFDPQVYVDWLAKQTPEVVEVEHKRLAKVEAYNKLHQRSIDNGVKTGVARAREDLQAAAEERDRLGKADAWDRGLTAEQLDRLRNDEAFARANSGNAWGAAEYDKAFSELRQYREQSEQAPVRQKIFDQALQHYGKAAQDNLLAALQSDPDLASVADWSKALVVKDVDAPPEEQNAQVFADVLKTMYRHAERKVRAELETKYQAESLSTIADALGTDPGQDPRLVTAGRANGTSSLQAVVNKAADPNQSLTDAEWKLYDQAVEKGIYPKRNN